MEKKKIEIVLRYSKGRENKEKRETLSNIFARGMGRLLRLEDASRRGGEI